MKKNKLLPILLLAGAGVAAYMYFKKKSAAKEIAEGIDMEPVESKTSTKDQNTTSSEEPEETKGVKLIKSAASILKKGKQLIKGKKRRKSRVEIGPTESSSTPFPETATTRKARRTAKRTVRQTARTARRTKRKSKVVTGFEF